MNKWMLIAVTFSITAASPANAGALMPQVPLTPKIGGISVPPIPGIELPRLPGGCETHVCGPQLPSAGWVMANVKQYNVYVTQQLLPGLQSWAGQPHARAVREGVLSAAGDVIVTRECPAAAPCTPRVNASGAPSALGKIEQVGRGLIPKGPAPPSPIMPDGGL